MSDMQPLELYDVVVIGGGPAGAPAAYEIAPARRSTGSRAG